MQTLSAITSRLKTNLSFVLNVPSQWHASYKLTKSNDEYLRRSQNANIEKTITFIESIRNRKTGLGKNTGFVELYKNPHGGSNAVVLHGVLESDLKFICQELSVGGFSTPRTDEEGRTVTAIYNNVIFNAYKKRYPQTPTITNFSEQQDIRYEASIQAAKARIAATNS